MAISKDQIENIYPLSPLQEGMLYHSLLEPESTAYFVQTSFRVEGPFEPAGLVDDVNLLVARHAVLRSVFVNDHTAQPLQVVLKERRVQAEIENAAHIPHSDRTAFIERRKAEDRQRLFVLARGPLLRIRIIRFEEQLHAVIWSHHHILLDGWSLAILLDELRQLQQQREQGHSRSLPERPPFSRYIAWLGRQDLETSLQYWQTVLAGFEDETPLLPTKAEKQDSAFQNAEYHWNLDERFSRRLRALAEDHGLTLNALLQAMWGILLAKINNSEDAVFGATMSGRPAAIPDVESMVGLFINTLPVRVCTRWQTVLDAVQSVQRSANAAQSHQYCSLADIQSRAGRSLFDHLFVFENFPFNESPDAGQRTVFADFKVWEQTGFDLTLTVNPLREIRFRFAYNAARVEKRFLERMADRFQRLVDIATLHPRMPVADIDIISSAERRIILGDWNQTDAPFPENDTIVSLFKKAVSGHSGGAAVVFGNRELTYRQLDRQSDCVAAALRARGPSAGARVGLLARRSDEMMTGLLGILKAGAAYVPLDPDYPAERLAFMVRDSGIKVVLTNVQPVNAAFAGSEAQVIAISDILTGPDADADPVAHPAPDDAAYVIYTSGSTGWPKGVEVEHRSIINRLHWMQRRYPIGPGHIILQKTPFTFDVSVWELFSWCLYGASLSFLEPGDERDPERLVEAIERTPVTTIHFVPSMLAPFLDYVEENRSQARLRSLQIVYTSGEALEPAHVAKFKDLLYSTNGTRLINLYGPTEATVEVSSFECCPGAAPDGSRIPIGKPIDNCRLYILDGQRRLQPIGVPGELAIGGVPVARGYLNQPELTRQKFVADPFRTGGRLYLTGDLCRWRDDGNIEYLGRMDSQVKMRGLRIETDEVAQCLLQYSGLRQAVVTLNQDQAHDATLCAYFTAAAAIDLEDLKRFIGSRLPEYMIPSWFCRLEEFPRTSSGKIDRKALPRPAELAAGGRRSAEAPRNRLERQLTDIWRQVLGCDAVGILDDFFYLGGHSLKAVRLISAVHRHFGVRISVKQVFESRTVQEMARLIRQQTGSAWAEIPAAPPAPSYALSSQQKRQFLLREFQGVDKAYNIVIPFHIQGRIDPQRVDASLAALIRKHESLRTRFVMVEGWPMQQIMEPEEAAAAFRDHGGFRVVRAGKGQTESGLRQALQPFDLSSGPLLRCVLTEAGEEAALWIELHHIVTDDLSNEVLSRDFLLAYHGALLSGESLHYKDYAVWQQGLFSSDTYARHEQWWMDQFKEELPPLQLPLDFTRPGVQSFDGDAVNFEIGAALGSAVHELSKTLGVTPFAVLLGSFYILLARCAGIEDLAVGVPVSGRSQPELEHVVGMFANTVAVRTRPGRDIACGAFLRQVQECFLGAMEHDLFPFEDLVEKLQIERDPGRNPLFDVMFVYHERDRQTLQQDCLVFTPVEIPASTSQFDLTLEAAPSGRGFRLRFVFATQLFLPGSVQAMARRFDHLLRQIVAKNETTIGSLHLMTSEEQAWIRNLNNTRSAFPSTLTLMDVFEEQVRQTPSAPAIVFESEPWSYEHLNREANAIAHHLISRFDIRPEEPVAIMAARSHWMVAGIFAILKSSGAYVPIDPEYPDERIRHILSDSGCRVLLVDELPAASGGLGIEVMPLRSARATRFDNPQRRAGSNGLAAILYTSGSTGRPKGVMLEHQGIVNRIHWLNCKASLTSTDVLLLKTPFTFDVSMSEIFWWTFAGASLAILKPREEKDPSAIARAVEAHGVSSIHFVPSMLSLFLEAIDVTVRRDQLASLRFLFASGEALKRQHVAGVRQKLTRTTPLLFYNLYGPTEASIEVSWFDCGNPIRGEAVPIGKPIDNLNLYVIDPENGQLQPPGIAGEICIGGQGVARGYWRNPALTSERFVELPAADGARVYRTGDLGRWNTDGELEYFGRMDFQVKVRGYRIELGEIESVLSQHPAVRNAVVDARCLSGSIPELVAYYVAEGSPAAEELRTHAGKFLPTYMIPAIFVRIDALPLNANGKIDRKALPSPQPRDPASSHLAPPRNQTEKVLLQLWKQVLGRPDIGVDSEFFESGGHSLHAARLSAAIFKTFSVQLALRDMYSRTTVRRQAERLELADGNSPPPIPAVEARDTYVLSPAQIRLWLTQQLAPSAGAYNLTVAVEIKGALDAGALESALNALVGKHEALRTVFVETENGPRQRILPAGPVSLEKLDLHLAPDNVNRAQETLDRQANRAFDLVEGPLFQATLIQLGTELHWFGLTMHHLVSDGWSIRFLISDIVEFYEKCRRGEAPALAAGRIQYKDFAEWQHRRLQGERLQNLLDYWITRLGPDVPPINLPADYPRPKTADFRGATRTFPVDAGLSSRLRETCKLLGATPFQFLLAVYFILVSRWSGQKTVIVGTSSEGREHPDLARVVGFFVNTVAMRAEVAEDVSFRHFLESIARNVIRDLEHQELPFDLLLQHLPVRREDGIHPVFQVRFVYQPFDLLSSANSLSTIDVRNKEVRFGFSKFDLSLNVLASQDEGRHADDLVVEYRTALFSQKTIRRFVADFLKLTEQAMEETDRPIARFRTDTAEAMSASERSSKLLGLQKISITPISVPRHVEED